MSVTLTVRELINELLDYDMDERVYISTGGDEYCHIDLEARFEKHSLTGIFQGIYLKPINDIKKADDE